MIQKALESENYDYITALAMADVFFTTGISLLKYKKPSAIFAGATNLGLSIEIYLKSLIVMEGNSKPNNHKLCELYRLLSGDLIKIIEKKYKEFNGADSDNDIFFIRGRKENSDSSENNYSPHNPSANISELLKQHKNMFITFRYMSEKGRSDEWEHFILEYENIKILIDILKNTSYNFLSEEQTEQISKI
ncbi:MAG: hypothetical protein U9R16_02965 [Campylobacterota bacterium]|nr:hypothetical protein [Campylobacterota bacterium]